MLRRTALLLSPKEPPGLSVLQLLRFTTPTLVEVWPGIHVKASTPELHPPTFLPHEGITEENSMGEGFEDLTLGFLSAQV